MTHWTSSALILLGVLVFVQGNFVGGMWYFVIGLFLRNAADMSYQKCRAGWARP